MLNAAALRLRRFFSLGPNLFDRQRLNTNVFVT